jgi:hypothetical protein
MSLWTWQKGRQKGTIYTKFPFYSFRIWKFGFDAFLLSYPEPTTLGFHRDPVENGKHWRMNIKFKGRSTFLIQKEDGLKWSKRIVNLFRPDKYPHALHVYTPTLKLSLGFVKFK